MDRFSPYFEDPAAHGMANPRPNRAFAHVYPFDEESLGRMAYYFEYDYADGRDPLDYAAPALAAVESWQALDRTVTLSYYDRPDGVLILHDTRPCATAFERRLTGVERAIYLACDTGHSLRRVVEIAGQAPGGAALDEPKARRVLDRWVRERIMVHLDGRYLSLALRKTPDQNP